MITLNTLNKINIIYIVNIISEMCRFSISMCFTSKYQLQIIALLYSKLSYLLKNNLADDSDIYIYTEHTASEGDWDDLVNESAVQTVT